MAVRECRVFDKERERGDTVIFPSPHSPDQPEGNEMAETTPCGLCGRGFEPRELTKHHLVPKEKGGTADDVEMICSQCHSMVHATFRNETLAKLYPHIKQLRKAPELEPFLKWVRKQPATRVTKNESRKRKV